MRRVYLIVALLILLLLVVGVLVLGAFPPELKQLPVEHVLPNDQFPSK